MQEKSAPQRGLLRPALTGLLATVLAIAPRTGAAEGAARSLTILPLKQRGNQELTAAQLISLSQQLPDIVAASRAGFYEVTLMPGSGADLWRRVQAAKGRGENPATDPTTGGAPPALKGALLAVQIGQHRVTASLHPGGEAPVRSLEKAIDPMTRLRTRPAKGSGKDSQASSQALVRLYAAALKDTVRILLSKPREQPIGLFLDRGTIAGLDPRQAVRRERVLHSARQALQQAVSRVNQANRQVGKARRRLTITSPHIAYTYRCWLHVDYSETMVMDCAKVHATGSALFWQAALTDIITGEQLVPLAAKILADATGQRTAAAARRVDRVAFLVDNSGSLIVNDFSSYLNGEPRQSRRYRAVKRLIEALGGLAPAPEVGILTFAAHDAQNWLGWFRADNLKKRQQALRELRASLATISAGGTDIAAALKTVVSKGSGPATMVLLTDGAQTVLPGPDAQPAITAEEHERALRYLVNVAQTQHRTGSWGIHVVNMQIANFESLRHVTRARRAQVLESWMTARFFSADEIPDIEGFITETNAGNHKVEELGVLASVAGPGTYWESTSLAADASILEGKLFGVLRLPVPRIHVLCDRQPDYETIVCDVPYLKPGPNALMVRNDFYDTVCTARIAKLSKGAQASLTFRQAAEDAIELDVTATLSGSQPGGSIGNVRAQLELSYVTRGGSCR